MSKLYELKEFAGNTVRVTDFIGRFSMNPEVIREMGGYPILTSEKMRWWVAIAEKKVIGFAAVKETAKHLMFTYSYVIPEWRRKGVYKATVAARMEWAKANGYKTIKADCTEFSLPYLLKLGFVKIQEFKGWTKVEHNEKVS